MLKAVLGTLVGVYLLIFWPGIPIANFLFSRGGTYESYFIPIYSGILVLSGLIVGCTYYIANLIKELKLDKKVDE